MQDLTFLRQTLLGAFRQARFEEQHLIFTFAMCRHHRRGGATQQLLRALPCVQVMGDTDTGAGPQRHFLQAQRRIDLRHDATGQLHGVERPFNAFSQNGEFGIA